MNPSTNLIMNLRAAGLGAWADALDAITKGGADGLRWFARKLASQEQAGEIYREATRTKIETLEAALATADIKATKDATKIDELEASLRRSHRLATSLGLPVPGVIYWTTPPPRAERKSPFARGGIVKNIGRVLMGQAAKLPPLGATLPNAAFDAHEEGARSIVAEPLPPLSPERAGDDPATPSKAPEAAFSCFVCGTALTWTGKDTGWRPAHNGPCRACNPAAMPSPPFSADHYVAAAERDRYRDPIDLLVYCKKAEKENADLIAECIALREAGKRQQQLLEGWAEQSDAMVDTLNEQRVAIKEALADMPAPREWVSPSAPPPATRAVGHGRGSEWVLAATDLGIEVVRALYGQDKTLIAWKSRGGRVRPVLAWSPLPEWPVKPVRPMPFLPELVAWRPKVGDLGSFFI